jgi:formamidopyrimidine-DNA glycosylase
MPELPEVETVMRGLQRAMEGRRLETVELRCPKLRFPFPQDFAARLKGRKVEAFKRRAKYILVSIEGGDCLLMHLGMTGRFAVIDPAGRARNLGEFYEEGAHIGLGDGPHDHVLFRLDNGTHVIYGDARRFGFMDLFPERDTLNHERLRNIGVEPLGNEFNAEYLAQAFAGKSAPLKAALLDQSIVAGLGNIYVCEALFRTGLSPKRKARTLVKRGKPDPRLEELVRHIGNVLTEAIAYGGSTLNDFIHTDGKTGEFQQRFAVYDREGDPCTTPNCRSTIRRLVQSGRSTFYCPTCQR